MRTCLKFPLIIGLTALFGYIIYRFTLLDYNGWENRETQIVKLKIEDTGRDSCTTGPNISCVSIYIATARRCLVEKTDVCRQETAKYKAVTLEEAVEYATHKFPKDETKMCKVCECNNSCKREYDIECTSSVQGCKNNNNAIGLGYCFVLAICYVGILILIRNPSNRVDSDTELAKNPHLVKE